MGARVPGRGELITTDLSSGDSLMLRLVQVRLLHARPVCDQCAIGLFVGAAREPVGNNWWVRPAVPWNVCKRGDKQRKFGDAPVMPILCLSLEGAKPRIPNQVAVADHGTRV